MKKHFRVAINSEQCKGCVLCISVCPLQLLTMSTTLNRKGYHAAETARSKECTGCLKCARMCPEAVIEIWNEP